jgi:hypothetical protein
MSRASLQHSACAAALVVTTILGPLPGCGAPDESRSDADRSDAGSGGGGDGQESGGGGGASGGPSGGPRVVNSEPAEGATTYAVEMLVSEGLNRKLLVLAFSEGMDVTVETVALRSLGEARDLPITWSDDGMTATADVPLTTFDSPERLPLNYDTSYHLDLRGLRARGGAPLDAAAAPLGDGVLDFRTFPRDRLLEHTCRHTDDEVELTSVLSDAPSDMPAIGTPHERYLLLFPTATSAGHAYMAPPSVLPFDTWEYTAFLTENVRFEIIERETGQPVDVTHYPVPHVCPGLRFASRFLLSEKPSTVTERGYDLLLSGDGFSSFEVFFERNAR